MKEILIISGFIMLAFTYNSFAQMRARKNESETKNSAGKNPEKK